MLRLAPDSSHGLLGLHGFHGHATDVTNNTDTLSIRVIVRSVAGWDGDAGGVDFWMPSPRLALN